MINLLDEPGVRTASRIAAWVMAAFVVLVTVCPLRDRPQTGFPDLERFSAYLVLGACFAFGYPKRVGLVAVLVVVAGLGLEASQLLAPDRHARVHDAVVKALGGAAGVCVAMLAEAVLRRTRWLPE